MRLHFLGANRQVTGSCYLLQAAGLNLLIDCGLFQEPGTDDRNDDDLPVPVADIDAVLLTHAHLDHVGRLPLLVKRGLRCPIITHHASADLASLVMEDAAKIQTRDSEEYGGRPLYDQSHAAAARELFEPHGYGVAVPVVDGNRVALVMHDAGHILGSATLELVISENGDKPRHIVFSGDVGQGNKPLIRDPQPPPEADVLILESTYGDRDHETPDNAVGELERIVQRTHADGGKLIVPTFAIERAQELLYYLNDLRESKRIDRLPVYLDSPMAARVTQLFDLYPELLDADALRRLREGDDPLDFPELYFTTDVRQSRAINEESRSAIILAGSGMCNAGRIQHHLVRYLDDPQHTLLFVGHQAKGTLGRKILDGESPVPVLDESRQVKAKVEQLHGMSAHADRTQLLHWLDRIDRKPSRIFLTHGEEDAATSFAKLLHEHHPPMKVSVPAYREAIDL